MAEELNVKIKADGSKLIEELKKVGVAVDDLNKNSKTININTNSAEVLKSIKGINDALNKLNNKTTIDIGFKDGISSKVESIAKSLDKIGKTGSQELNINVTSSGVDTTLLKLQGLLAVLKELKQNNRIKIDMGTTGNYGKTRNSQSVKDEYQSLARIAKESALEAEKAWGTDTFAGAKKAFTENMTRLTDFKRELGNSSIGSARGIYANMAMSVGKDSPLYDDLVTKVKSLNVEQQKYNELIGRSNSGAGATSKREIVPKQTFVNLRTEAVSAAKTLDDAFSSGKGVESATNKLEGALNALVNFKRASGSLSLGSEANLYATMLPSVQKSGQAYNTLLGRISAVNLAQTELNKVMGKNTGAKSSSSGSKSASNGINPLNDPANILQNISRLSKGTGSAGEVIGRQLFNLEKIPGAVGEAATAAAGLTAAFAASGLAAYGIYSAISTVSSGLETIAGLVERVIKPGLEFNTKLELMTNGLAGAIASVGQIGDKQVSFNDALGVSTKLMKQLSVDALKIGVAPDELTGTFRSILEPSLQAGMTMSQTRKIASTLTSTGAEMGISGTTLTRDASDIIRGQNVKRTKLGSMLGLEDADIASAKASAGGLFAFLQDRMSGYAESSQNLPNTVGGAWKQLNGFITMASASLTADFMPNIVNALQYAESFLGVIKEDDNGDNIFIPSDNIKILEDALERLAVYLASCIDFIIVFAQSMTGTEDPIDAVVNLIEDMIGFVVLATTTLITFGKGCYAVFDGIVSAIMYPIAVFAALGNSIMAVISAIHALWAAMAGDKEGATALLAQSDKYSAIAKNLQENSYHNTKNNDLLRGQEKGSVTEAVQKAIADSKKPKVDKDGNKVDPDSIKTRFPADDSKAKIADSKKASQEAIQLLKDNLADQLDYYKRHMDEIELAFKQNAISIDDYFKEKTTTDTAEAQAKVDETNAEIDVVNNQQFKDERDRNRALSKLDKSLSKYTRELNDAVRATAEISNMQTEFYNNMQKNQSLNGATNGEATQAVGTATAQLENYGADSGISKEIIDQIVNESIKYGVDPKLSTALMMQESGGNQNAVSGSGAVGLFQLMPDTAQGLGVNPYDQNQNITGGIQYLRDQLVTFEGDQVKAMAAYNAGPQAVKDNNGVPPYKETQNYVTSIQGKMQDMSGIQDIRGYMQDYIKEQSIGLVTEASKSMNAGFQEGFNNLNNVTMDNMREGCVEAVTKIGSYFNKFLGDELKKGVVNTDVLRSDASSAGVQEIPFSHDKLAKGDVVVYDNGEHVLLYEGNDKVFGNASSALDNIYGAGNGPGKVMEQNLYQGQEPTSILKTGAQGADSIGISTIATTKQSMEAKEKYNAELEAQLKAEQNYYALFGQGATQEKLRLRMDMQKQIDKAQANHNEKLVGELRVTLEAMSRDIDVKYLKQNLDYQVKSIQSTAVTMGAKIGLGLYDINDAVDRYYGDIYNKTQTVYSMINGVVTPQVVTNPIKATIDTLRAKMSEYMVTGTNQKEYNDIKVLLEKVYTDLANIFKSFIQKIDDLATFRTTMIENDPNMTTGQKETAKSQISRDKASSELVVQRAELKKKVDTYQNDLNDYGDIYSTWKTTSNADVKNKASADLKILKDEIKALQFTDIPLLQQTIQTNEQLAKMPKLLDKVGVAAKQSLEDGMNTFLTDGIDNAKSLSEAFNDLIVSVLKSIQKVFAQSITQTFMNKIFPVTNPAVAQKKSSYNIMDSIPAYTNYATGKQEASWSQYNPLTSSVNIDFLGKNTKKTNTNGSSTSSLTSSMSELQSTTYSALSTIDGTISQIVARINATSAKINSTVSSLSASGVATTDATTTSKAYSFNSSDYDLSNKFAIGGIVPGEGTGDTVNAMLTPGEGIITAPMVSKLGTGFIHAVNKGNFSSVYSSLPKFATGGVVGDVGAQTTARGMTSFSDSIGSNVSTTNKISVALVRDEQEAMEHFMKSSGGERVLLDFSRKNASFVNKITNRR